MKKVKALLYCTKKQPYLVKDDFPLENEPIYFTHYKEPGCCGLPLNGKIVAKCEVETEEIRLSEYPYYDDCSIALFDTPTLTNDELLDKSCLHHNELNDYLIGQKGYALHIKNLEELNQPLTNYIYKKPSDFNHVYKAPQNMMRVYDKFDNEYILISVRPEWLCKILNGEKTIEVRIKVLKEML
jgi:hypothetical protein